LTGADALDRLVARAVVVGALLAVATSFGARAQTILEKLVMPGPLVAGHAKLEKECSNCHEPFSRQSQTRLCLACHKDTASDRRDRRGFHGRQADALSKDCKFCHSDHKGRTADIVQLDRETFNHAVTNFELKGLHKTARCEGCHASSVPFRRAASRCFDCHKSKDPHRLRLGEACDGCHSEDGWRRVKAFDHSKTKFALEGAHKDVDCASCHAGERYKDLPTTCVSCHRLQDAHAARYGAKCETCHASTKWKTVKFNHDRMTKFPLRGEHTKVKCDTCHAGDLYRDKLATTCVSCHKKDDAHKAQLGTRCEQCHKETGWRRQVSFDHDVTRFPLIGRHAIVPCEECHRSTSFKEAPRACTSCHKDQHHEGRLTGNCALCHNPNGWARWRFDHNTQTRYVLDGAHRGLNCHGCHTVKMATKISLSSACVGCHSKDDVHQGSFGKSCERCHNTTSFKRGVLRR
jgi:hypothetical protein